MILDAVRRCDRETALVALLSGAISVAAFFYYFSHGELLLYGDAVAHINIARRVFDSRTPGLLQLGTVWLPLPHLVMIPFLISDRLWRTGVGGSIASMIAYVFGAVGIFRLTKGAMATTLVRYVQLARWGAVFVYTVNPNLIYLQTAAMTEPIYLALFIWTLVYFSDFLRAANAARTRDSTLIKCGLCLTAACLTRYDGWFLATVLCILVVLNTRHRTSNRSLATFVLLAIAAPTLWLAYNAAIYRNPLEFANGPYSARAIEKKTAVPGAPPHPGAGAMPVSASYFLKSAELNVAGGDWGRFWLLFAVLGTAIACAGLRNSMPALLLWIPLPFYMLSITHGGVPIFLPVWWPFSLYNARYGLELLPAFAIFVPFAVLFAIKHFPSRNLRLTAAIAFFALLLASYASVWRDPICLQEGRANSRTRIALEREVAAYLRGLPGNSTLLMYLGDHVGALQDAGIPLRRVINEGNHRVWKQPSDPEGQWERALANPDRYADFVIAFEHDPVSEQVNKTNITSLAVVHLSGQPRATIYRVAVR
jgi:hypothetical protein